MWETYIKKRGSLNVGMRLEQGFALVAFQINRANGGKAELKDFMPHFDEREVSLDEAMRDWT